MGMEREQKFGMYFGGWVVVGTKQESSVGKVAFSLWPGAFILKRRGRGFGRDFLLVKTSMSRPALP